MVESATYWRRPNTSTGTQSCGGKGQAGRREVFAGRSAPCPNPPCRSDLLRRDYKDEPGPLVRWFDLNTLNEPRAAVNADLLAIAKQIVGR